MNTKTRHPRGQRRAGESVGGRFAPAKRSEPHGIGLLPEWPNEAPETRHLSDLIPEDPEGRVIGGSTTKFYDPARDAFIKLDAMQNEALREEFSSRAALIMGLSNAVQYSTKQLVQSGSDQVLVGVESVNFKKPDERERPLSYFRREEFVEEDEDWDSDEEFFIENDEWKQLKAQIETMNAATGSDFSADVLKMSAFDIIIGNTDRISNLSNIGVIEENDGGYRLIPPFDFGMAFPPKDEHDFLGEGAYMDRVRSFAAFAHDQYGHGAQLLVNQEEMHAFIESYSNPLYCDEEVQNIKDQLTQNLRRTEGILWQRR